MIAESIRKLTERCDLSRDETRATFAELMDGSASEVQKSAFLIALRMKGETVEEITGAAQAMRERVSPLDVEQDNLIDTCGTGGDGCRTFNISTTAALVAAAAGARVAKHGNRAVSSSCGSADVLIALGVNVELTPQEVSAVLREVGIAFLFAPRFHPATGAVAPVRKELGVRTIFNLLGPLTNPAFARRQLVGVYARPLVPVVAQVLRALGVKHALVVHSDDGMDEISISAPTEVCELKGESIQMYRLTPEQLGFRSAALDTLAGGSAQINAAITRSVLSGQRGPARDIVLANAGAAIYVSGVSDSVEEGITAARAAIDNGRAMSKLEQLIEATRVAAETSA